MLFSYYRSDIIITSDIFGNETKFEKILMGTAIDYVICLVKDFFFTIFESAP